MTSNIGGTLVALCLLLVFPPSAHAQENCSTTTIVLPLRISMDALQDLLNRELPRELSGREGISISGVRDEALLWTMTRSAIELRADNDRLRANTRISGTVRVNGALRPFGRPRFSVSVDLGADADLGMRPAIGSEWRVRPNMNATVRIQEAEVGTPLGNISVRSHAQAAADRLLGRMVTRLNDTLASDDFLQRAGESLWSNLHRSVQVSEYPEIWITMAPSEIGISHAMVTNDGVDFTLFLTAATEMIIGSTPPNQPLRELPTLELVEEPTEGELELVVPIFADWEALNAILADRLAASLPVHEGENARLVLNGIDLSGRNDGTVAISAAMSIVPTGWLDRVLLFLNLGRALDEQTVAMTANLGLSDDGASVVLDNVSLGEESSALIDALARTYEWLTDDTIGDLVERHSTLDLGQRFEAAGFQAQEKVDQLLEDLGGQGIAIDAELQFPIKLASLTAQSAGLLAEVCATAMVAAEIYSLEF